MLGLTPRPSPHEWIGIALSDDAAWKYQHCDHCGGYRRVHRRGHIDGIARDDYARAVVHGKALPFALSDVAVAKRIAPNEHAPKLED